MAIGNIQLGGTAAQQYSNPNVSENAFGAGVGVALKGLSESLGKLDLSTEAIATAHREEIDRRNRFDAQKNWAALQGQISREQADALTNAPVDGGGLTESRAKTLRAQQEAFLASIPDPRLREELRAETETFVQSYVTDTYMGEFKLRTNYETDETTKLVGNLAGEIMAGRTTMEAAAAQVDELLSTTRLGPVEKQALKDAALATLAPAQFQKTLETVQTGGGTVREPDGTDVVAAGLTPWERAFLNTTAADESNGSYTIITGGQQFSDFSDHPRVYVPQENGDVSSAAGRYQFTAQTWDEVAAELGLTDFSPENQDRAAIHLARKRYNLGRSKGDADFDTVMATGTDAEILEVKRVLAPTWAAFATMPNDRFLSLFKGAGGLAGGGTGAGNIPDVWTDPRFAGVDFNTKAAMAGQAQSAITAMRTAAEAQKEAAADLARAQVALGKMTADEIEAGIAAGQFRTQDVDALMKLAEDTRDEERASVAFGNALSAGQVMGNTTENQKAALKHYQKTGVMDGLSSADPAAATMLAQTFAKSGVLPPEVSDLLQSMMFSNDPRKVQYGMDTLAAMKAKSPDMFGFALPKEMVEAETAWSMLRRYAPAGDPNSLLKQFNDWRSPEGRANRKVFEKEAEDSLKEITEDDMLNAFDPSIFVNGPAAPAYGPTRAMMRQDFDALYKQYYSLFQDPDQTTAFVAEQMKYSWQPTSVDGTNRLMYLAPESGYSGYPRLEGSYDWMRDDIISSQGWSEDEQFTLVSDPQSEGDVARGEPASYLIAKPNESGQWALVMEETEAGMVSSPKRFRPTITPEVAQTTKNKVQATNLAEKEGRLAAELALAQRTGRVEDAAILNKQLSAVRGAIAELGVK